MQQKNVETINFKEKNNMEGEAMGFNSILGEQEIDDLFPGTEETPDPKGEEQQPGQEPSGEPGGKEKDNNEPETTEDVNPDDLFGDQEEQQPESVGSGKEKEDKDKGSTVTDKGSSSSPENFYSSIANAFAVDGILPNLDEEKIKNAKTAEDISDLIEEEVNARLEEKQQRVAKALENGVEASDIRKYEKTIQFVNSITDAAIAEDSEKGEELRRNIIFQDFLNQGYTEERARKFTDRAFDNGTDIEDAKEALVSNRQFFQDKYNKLLQDAQAKADADKEQRIKAANDLKDSMMKDKNLLGDMEISADIRKKAFDFVMRPTFKTEDGEYITPLQKYQIEHKADFLKYVGLFMVLTDNFKDFKSFAKGEAKKELKKGLRELEQTLNTTRRNSDGTLKPVTTRKEDPESFFGDGFKLAL